MINRNILSSIALAASMISSPFVAMAATVTIDDFNLTRQSVVAPLPAFDADGSPGFSSGGAIAAEALGGRRGITAIRTSTVLGQQSRGIVENGAARFELDAGGSSSIPSGQVLFRYQTFGADLVDGTNDRILLNVLSSIGSSVEFELNIDGAAVTRSSPSSSGFLDFGFSEFAGVDFTNVSTINLRISGIGESVTVFDNFVANDGRVIAPGPEVAPVPLPASVPLLLAGLGMLGIVGRRRSRR